MRAKWGSEFPLLNFQLILQNTESKSHKTSFLLSIFHMSAKFNGDFTKDSKIIESFSSTGEIFRLLNM